MEDKKTILVTGGAGFVGSHLCKRYLDEGHRVISLDNLQKNRSTVNIDKFMDNPDFKFIKHDIVDPIKIDERVDWVMNFACPVSCVDLQVDPIHTLRSSVDGVINMLEIARAHKAVFIQASSSDVYGVRDKGDAPAESELGNVDQLTTRACYEEGKRVAETAIMDYHRKYGVDVKIARIFNTYGPNMYYRDGRVMSNFIIAALSGKDLTIYGDGSFTRAHMYVSDLVEGIDRLTKKPKGFTGPVNLGSEHEITVKELAEIVIKMTGSKSKIIYDKELTGDPKFRRANIKLARKELDWEPKVGLEEGAKKTIEHYKQIDIPDKKILVFTTTYYPDHGPAERALMELAKKMDKTEFHLITVKSRKELSDFERIENVYVYRLGAGNVLGKYLFPWRGARKARELAGKFKYRFVWSVMASYGALAAIFFKQSNKELSFLMTFDKTELEKRGQVKAIFIQPIMKYIFKKADVVYLGDKSLEKEAKKLGAKGDVGVINKETEEFMSKVQQDYSTLLNKQDGKLDRPL